MDGLLRYANCALCPRRCGADRTAGELGFCRMPGRVRAARAAAHHWEEPVLSGTKGSGTVFFSGCTLRCGFCQNREISREGRGTALDAAGLRAVFEELIAQGVHNINLVTPTHFLPDIVPALTPKLGVPVVYNCGGYESVETLRALEGLVDVYLPDFKYSDGALAARLSAAADYPARAADALAEMVRQTGPCVLEDGLLVRGTLARHLVLPGHVDNSLGVVDLLADRFPEAWVSLMAQYTPMGPLAATPPFDRRVTEEEYAAVVGWARLRGLKHGFVQEFSAAEAAYVPAFDGTGLPK